MGMGAAVWETAVALARFICLLFSFNPRASASLSFLGENRQQPVKYEGGLSMYTVTFEHSSIVYTTFDHEDAIAFAVNQAMLLHDAYYIRKD